MWICFSFPSVIGEISSVENNFSPYLLVCYMNDAASDGEWRMDRIIKLDSQLSRDYIDEAYRMIRNEKEEENLMNPQLNTSY